MEFYFAYAGSKRAENVEIESLVMDNIGTCNKVVEVFGGSLAFSRWMYSKMGNKLTYLCSDADKDLVHFCNTFPGLKERVTECVIQKTKELYSSPLPGMSLREYFQSTPTTNFDKLVHYLVVRKNSGCLIGFFRKTPCKFTKFSKETVKTDDFFINGTIYKEQDFTTYLEQVKNDESAMVYLDPPYLEKNNSFYVSKDLKRIFPYLNEWMNTCKCKFVLVHSKCDYLDTILSETDGKFRLWKTYDKNYKVAKDVKKNTIHYVITNM
jgi:site-specific DNA-adenine methylase